jgi:hypothetical protein
MTALILRVDFLYKSKKFKREFFFKKVLNNRELTDLAPKE